MVRKLLIVAAVVLALVAVSLTAAAWRTASVPSWYAPEEPERGPPTGASAADGLGDLLGIDLAGAARAGALVQRLLDAGRVELDSGQLADLVHTALSGSRDGRVFLDAAGPLQARIGDGELEVGALVDLAELRAEEIDDELAAALDHLRSWAPFLAGERFVGLRGVPTVLDGDLGLADGATLRIGELGLPLELLVPSSEEAPLRRRLTIDLLALRVTRVEVAGNRLVVEANQRTGR